MKSPLVYLTVVSLAFSTGRAFAGDPVPPVSTNAPHVALTSEVFDFGKVSSGEKITNEFVFTNTGTATLIITNVQPACHCTTAGNWTKAVEPGKTGVIPLVLDSTSFVGPVTRTVSVTCNDPRRPIFSLTMKGNVWRPIDVHPLNAIFNVASDMESVDPVVLHITNHLDGPVTLGQPECPNQSLSAELKTIQPGWEFELVVKMKTPISSTGVSGIITIKTSSPKIPAIDARVFAIIRPALAVVPSQINLLPGPLAVSTTNYITIVNSSTNHPVLSLKDLSGPTNGVTLRMTEVQPGKQFNVAVGFPAGYQVPPGVHPEISFKTSHPQYQQVVIPVIQPNQPPAFAAPRPAVMPHVPLNVTNSPAVPALISTNPPPLPPHVSAAKGQ